jgi:hypothetical protein
LKLRSAFLQDLIGVSFPRPTPFQQETRQRILARLAATAAPQASPRE